MQAYLPYALYGLITGVSFLHPALWLLAIVGPFLFLRELFCEEKKYKHIFLKGVAFGAVFLGTVFVWIWEAFPLDWLIEIKTSVALLLVFVGWFGSSFVLGSSFGFFAIGAYVLLKRGGWAIVFIPLLWISLEYIRAWFFGFLFMGAGTLLGAHVSVGFIGYAFAYNPLLLQLASFGGVYTLGFALLCGVMIIFHITCIEKKYSSKTYIKYSGAIFTIVMLGSVYIYNLPSTEEGTPVAVLHTTFETEAHLEPATLQERLLVINNLVKEVASFETIPDILVLPEDSRFIGLLVQNGFGAEYAQDVFDNRETMIVDSSRVDGEAEHALSKIFYFNTSDGSHVTSEKRFLVPGGEYLPYFYRSFLRIIGNEDVINRFDYERTYKSGETVQVAEVNGNTIGALFCSEIVSPQLYRSLYKQFKPNVLINVASHGYFDGSRVLHHQILAFAKVHAVQNRTPFIQSGNMTPSFVINKWGNVISESSWESNEVIYANL